MQTSSSLRGDDIQVDAATFNTFGLHPDPSVKVLFDINVNYDEKLYRREPFHPRLPRDNDRPLEQKDLVHIVFLYSKENREKFSAFEDFFKNVIDKHEVLKKQNIKYERYDSSKFSPNIVDCVAEICDCAMVILPFLTKELCSDDTLKFILGEGIGTTRLNDNPPIGDYFSVAKKQMKYCIRPIHTQPRGQRLYKTPPGLTTTRGIDYSNKDEEDVIKLGMEVSKMYKQRSEALNAVSEKARYQHHDTNTEANVFSRPGVELLVNATSTSSSNSMTVSDTESKHIRHTKINAPSLSFRGSKDDMKKEWNGNNQNSNAKYISHTLTKDMRLPFQEQIPYTSTSNVSSRDLCTDNGDQRSILETTIAHQETCKTMKVDTGTSHLPLSMHDNEQGQNKSLTETLLPTGDDNAASKCGWNLGVNTFKNTVKPNVRTIITCKESQDCSQLSKTTHKNVFVSSSTAEKKASLQPDEEMTIGNSETSYEESKCSLTEVKCLFDKSQHIDFKMNETCQTHSNMFVQEEGNQRGQEIIHSVDLYPEEGVKFPLDNLHNQSTENVQVHGNILNSESGKQVGGKVSQSQTLGKKKDKNQGIPTGEDLEEDSDCSGGNKKKSNKSSEKSDINQNKNNYVTDIVMQTQIIDLDHRYPNLIKKDKNLYPKSDIYHVTTKSNDLCCSGRENSMDYAFSSSNSSTDAKMPLEMEFDISSSSQLVLSSDNFNEKSESTNFYSKQMTLDIHEHQTIPDVLLHETKDGVKCQPHQLILSSTAKIFSRKTESMSSSCPTLSQCREKKHYNLHYSGEHSKRGISDSDLQTRMIELYAKCESAKQEPVTLHGKQCKLTDIGSDSGISTQSDKTADDEQKDKALKCLDSDIDEDCGYDDENGYLEKESENKSQTTSCGKKIDEDLLSCWEAPVADSEVITRNLVIKSHDKESLEKMFTDEKSSSVTMTSQNELENTAVSDNLSHSQSVCTENLQLENCPTDNEKGISNNISHLLEADSSILENTDQPSKSEIDISREAQCSAVRKCRKGRSPTSFGHDNKCDRDDLLNNMAHGSARLKTNMYSQNKYQQKNENKQEVHFHFHYDRSGRAEQSKHERPVVINNCANVQIGGNPMMKSVQQRSDTMVTYSERRVETLTDGEMNLPETENRPIMNNFDRSLNLDNGPTQISFEENISFESFNIKPMPLEISSLVSNEDTVTIDNPDMNRISMQENTKTVFSTEQHDFSPGTSLNFSSLNHQISTLNPANSGLCESVPSLKTQSKPAPACIEKSSSPKQKPQFGGEGFHEGILTYKHVWRKEKKKVYMRSWKKRHIILNGNTLSFHKVTGDINKISGETIALTSTVCAAACDYKKRPHVFRIQQANGGEYLFSAKDEREMEIWIQKTSAFSRAEAQGAITKRNKKHRLKFFGCFR